MSTTDYLGHYYLLEIGMIMLRILVLSWGAVLLWRCGPKLETLLAPKQVSEPLSQ